MSPPPHLKKKKKTPFSRGWFVQKTWKYYLITALPLWFTMCRFFLTVTNSNFVSPFSSGVICLLNVGGNMGSFHVRLFGLSGPPIQMSWFPFSRWSGGRGWYNWEHRLTQCVRHSSSFGSWKNLSCQSSFTLVFAVIQGGNWLIKATIEYKVRLVGKKNLMHFIFTHG